MYYLTLAMHTINITQVPGGSYSHANNAMDLAGADTGIDYWYCRTGYMKCIGKWAYGYNTYFFQPCDSKGKAVEVMCADGESRIVTLAMTHSNLQYVKTQVGKIYKQDEPVYEEGTKGNATGNHIHLEIAQGTRTTKSYDSKLKVYRMAGELNPAKVMFIDTSFSKIKNLAGLTFIRVTTPIYSGSAAVSASDSKSSMGNETIGYGYLKTSKNGITAHTYRAKGYDLHLISAGEITKTQSIDKFDSSKITKVAVINCNYFNVSTGLHYGVEQDGLIEGFTVAPKSSGLCVYYVTPDGKSNACLSNSYWLMQDQVQVAFTPYAVLLLNGKKVSIRSSNLTNKDSKSQALSAVARMKNGEFVLAVFEKAKPADAVTFFQSYGGDAVQDVCILDGGGSSQMRVWKDNKMQTIVAGDKRKLPNVLCLAKKR